MFALSGVFSDGMIQAVGPYRPNRKSVEENRLTQSCGQPALLINLLSRQPIFLGGRLLPLLGHAWLPASSSNN